MSMMSKVHVIVAISLSSLIGACSAHSDGNREQTKTAIQEQTIIPEHKVENDPSETSSIRPAASNPGSESGGREDLRYCDLKDFLVKREIVLARSELCPAFKFHTIKVLNNAVLTIKAGTQLVGEGEDSRIEVEYAGTLNVLGTLQKSVTVRGGSVENPLRLLLFGTATLRNVDFSNTTIRAWGAKTAKDFDTVSIDNAGVLVKEAALECSDCHVKSMRNLSISNHMGLPVVITLGSLGNLSRDSIQIDSDTYSAVEVYAGVHTGPRIGEHRRLPNIGYPYQVKSSLLLDSESFVIEPGVTLQLCNECVLYSVAKTLRIGESGKEPVKLVSLSETWPGIVINKSTVQAQIENTLIQNTRGTQLLGCPAAALSFEGETEARLSQVSLLPAAGGVMSLSAETAIFMDPTDVSLIQRPSIYFRERLNNVAAASVERFGDVQLTMCNL